MPRSQSSLPTASMSLPAASGSSIPGVSPTFGVYTPSARTWSSTFMLLRYRSARIASPRLALTLIPASTVASDAVGDGPEYRYGAAETLRWLFSQVGRARNAISDEYDLEKPPTSTMLSYVSPQYFTIALPRMPYGEVSLAARSPSTPKPWASSTYSSAPCSRATAAKAFRSGALPVMLLTPSIATSLVTPAGAGRSTSARCP